jgi:hypothetical protein
VGVAQTNSHSHHSRQKASSKRQVQTFTKFLSIHWHKALSYIALFYVILWNRVFTRNFMVRFDAPFIPHKALAKLYFVLPSISSFSG